MERDKLRKLVVVMTAASGVVAAYLMYKRGESLPTIALRAVTNPVGSLVAEIGSLGQA